MKSELSLPRTDAYFKYPMEGLLGIYATAAFMQVQGELRDFKWTYLLVGAQYLAQRWREVNLSNDIRRLQFYITGSVSKGQRPPRTALRAMHATYKRIRKVYATRPLDQRVQILQHWASAVKPALAMRYLSEEDDCKYKQPLAACLKEAERTIDNYYKTRPGLNQEIDLPKEEPQRIEPTYAYPRMYDMDLRLEPRNPYDYRDSRNYR